VKVNFLNSYSELPSRFYQKIKPAHFDNPTLIKFNEQLAQSLGIDLTSVDKRELALIFSGQKILVGSDPMALAYAGHQFGHFVPQLGDGRALLLGEINGQDIQLKGSGQTQFSRRGDGFSALGPVLREYIVSEAMFHLGVSTTRALAAVSTGVDVYRNDLEPGGVFTRVAPSHLRVGTFQYFAVRDDKEGLEILLNYAIKRHFPDLESIKDLSLKALNFIAAVGKVQANLIAKWMSLGFIHGVMNTDNSSIGGFTLDFGPCAFMDEYTHNKVFSSIDRNGRYAYNNQVEMGKWNLLRLAESLISLIDSNQQKAISKVEEMIDPVFSNFDQKRWEMMALKFGISEYQQSDKEMMESFLNYLEEEELDFTLAFRNLANLHEKDSSFFPNISKLSTFQAQWEKRLTSPQNFKTVNPLYIPRNHQVEKAIQNAYHGDFKVFHELIQVLKSPFEENPNFVNYSLAPDEEQRVTHTFCGT